MNYIRPEDVRSPKAMWQLIDVLLDKGEGDCAYALGEWDGERRIGFRWNGNAEKNPIGNPQSRGLPTWTMLDPAMHESVIAILPSDKQSLARRFLGTNLIFDCISVSGDRSAILMWDMRHNPCIVAKIDCDVLRNVLKIPDMPDDACRLVTDTNKEILAEVAEAMFAKEQCRNLENGIRVIDVSLNDLTPIAGRLSTSVLEVAARSRWIGL